MNGETYPEITTNSDENEKQNDISIEKKFKSQNELTDTQGMNELITNLVKNRDYLEKFLIFENKKNTAKKKINKNTFKNNQNDSYNGRKQIPKKKENYSFSAVSGLYSSRSPGCISSSLQKASIFSHDTGLPSLSFCKVDWLNSFSFLIR